MNKLLILTAALGLSAFSASAQQDPVTAEVIEGWRMPDGTQVTALRLTLAPGWKTYWRAPGDAGIPPQFDWSGSRNLQAVSISWPTPKVFEQSGTRSIGYKDKVVLPIYVTPRNKEKPVNVALSLDIGVCRDICMPKTLTLSATLNATGDKPTPAIAAAVADRPYTGREAGAGKATCRLTPNEDGLEITATVDLPQTGGREHVVIEPGRDDIWVSETDSSRKGRTLIATADMVPVSNGPMALDRSKVKITILGGKHAVELTGCSAG